MKQILWLVAKCILLVAALALSGYLVFGAWWGSFVMIAVVLALFLLAREIGSTLRANKFKGMLGDEAPVLTTDDGFSFRDLNKNGKLDIYEDPRQPIDARVEDLLSQMSMEEKAGLMFSPMMGGTNPGKLHRKGGLFSNISVLEVVAGKKINTFACLGAATPRQFALWHNACQKLAERTRLGIPLTVCSDPRHHFMGETNPLSGIVDAGVSAWPLPLGLSSARDEQAVEAFGDIARQELTAMGIRFALHPVADTATEPRWPRISETFGEDADVNSRMVAAYVRGFQGGELGRTSVACCVKHFPGGGPQKDGDDPHFEFGKDQIYPGNNFNYHVKPFAAAFGAGAAATMPYYGRPVGLDGIEEVGFNFNRQITHDLLRDTMNFNGVVHTDYGIIAGGRLLGMNLKPRAWGVEDLTTEQRMKKAVDAGIDQAGGESCSEVLVSLVRGGLLPESRLDESCRRVLALKFRLGLFDDPYVDPQKAEEICGSAAFNEAGEQAMRLSLVLLKNGSVDETVLPLKQKPRLYVEGFVKKEVEKWGDIVKRPEQADYALLHIDAPSRFEGREALALMFKSGRLDYTDRQKAHLKKVMCSCPTIVVINMTRPSVIPEISEFASAILCDFGAKDKIILETIFGCFSPTGRLPFELPRSMEAVEKKKSDTPFSSEDPLYPYDFGLTYTAH